MKKLLFTMSMLISSILLLPSCEGDKKGSSDTEKTNAEEMPPVQLFLTSCESTDSTLCDKSACKSSNCGIEDFYFTPKGNVIQRVSCADEEDALWVVGKYRVSDSGMVCQMDKVYIVSLKKQEGIDTVNYNSGEYTNLESREPFLLEKSACTGVQYTKRYSDEQRLRAGDGAPFGRMYYEDKAWEEKMITEMRKVNAFRDL
jgi:hypothetical protein